MNENKLSLCGKQIARQSVLLLLVVTSNQMFASNSAQNTRISLSLTDVTLKEAIDAIEEKTEFVFFYNNSEVDIDEKVSVNVNNTDIKGVLTQILPSNNYKIDNYKIVILPEAEPHQVPQQESRMQITGIVKDSEGVPLPGTAIIAKGEQNNYATTDIDGTFSITVNVGTLLEFSYIGFLTKTVDPNGKAVLDVTLDSDLQSLQEVVVVGYGTQKKENLTGAITVIKMEDVLGERPVINAMSALQGSVAGLTITGGSSPGQTREFSIRGDLSINGGSPLVLIDNVPGDINMVNPDDIETITILKDASSAAIYGARAAGGVIMITTKRPKAGAKFKVNYGNSFGWERSINRPVQAPGEDFLTALLDAEFTGGKYYAQSQDVAQWRDYLIGYKADPSQYETVGSGIYMVDGINYYLEEQDLYGNALENGFLMTHNLSVSGGTEDVQYRISGGYSSEDGPFITNKDKYERLNIGAYISAKMTNWFTQQIDMRYANAQKEMPYDPSGTLYGLRIPSLHPEGIMPAEANGPAGKDLPILTPRNILLDANTSNTKNDDLRIFTKSIFNLFEGFDAVFEYTHNKKTMDYTLYTGQWAHTTNQLGEDKLPNTDNLTKNKTFTNYNSINAYATYSRDFNGHNLKVMAGYSQEWEYYEGLKNEAFSMISQTLPSIIGSSGKQIMTDEYKENSIRSGFYRFNYDYKGRYLFEASGRYDGSSKFPREDRFGFFPSFSAGWNIAKESFFTNQNWAQELKLRASWGQIGNQRIDPYKYTPSMATGQFKDWMMGGIYPVYIGMPGLVSQAFTWKKVQTLDIGIDFSILQNRLTGTLGWYQRDTKGMLTQAAELPGVLGASAPLENAADMRTRGWEVAINWRHQVGDFGYSVGFNISDYMSEITKFDNESGVLKDKDGNLKQNYKGRNFGEIWGYRADGYYTVDDFQDTNTWKLKDDVTSIQGVNVRPGDVKFKNLRDDDDSKNQIDAGTSTLDDPGDMEIIGNSTPRFQYGANFGFNYLGFDLSIFLQGVGKREVWASGGLLTPFGDGGRFGSLYEGQQDYWQPIDASNGNWNPVNADAKYHRIYGEMANNASNAQPSDKYLQNGAYLRVKNVTLSYTFPEKWMQKAKIDRLRLFVSFENPFTFTSLPDGFDPERLTWNYPFYSTSSVGINISF